MLRLLCCGVVLGLVGALVGCESGGPKTYEVKGKLSIKGQPAKGVRISFQPVDPKGVAASGVVNEQGQFTMYSGVEGKPGVAAGQYKVVLMPDMSGVDPSKMYEKATGAPKAEDKAIPAEWQNAGTTPKTVEVKAGVNDVNIEL